MGLKADGPPWGPGAWRLPLISAIALLRRGVPKWSWVVGGGSFEIGDLRSPRIRPPRWPARGSSHFPLQNLRILVGFFNYWGGRVL